MRKREREGNKEIFPSFFLFFYLFASFLFFSFLFYSFLFFFLQFFKRPKVPSWFGLHFIVYKAKNLLCCVLFEKRIYFFFKLKKSLVQFFVKFELSLFYFQKLQKNMSQKRKVSVEEEISEQLEETSSLTHKKKDQKIGQLKKILQLQGLIIFMVLNGT